MRDLSELIAHVQSLVGDVLVATPTFVLSALNLAVVTLVRDTRPPDMIKISTAISVAATDMSKAMPTDFLGPRVFRAYNLTTGVPINKVMYRLVDFFRASPGEASSIQCICVKGSQFFLQPGRSAAEDVQFTYMKKPQVYVDDEVKDATVLSPFPLIEIAEEAIAQHAAYQAFLKIEEGVDGKKVNAEAALNAYNTNAAYFVELFGPQNREQEPEFVMPGSSSVFARGEIW